MDTTSIIGQDAALAGLHQQSAVQASAMKKASQAANQKQMRDAAKDFEAFFIGQMMEHMTAGIETNETFGGGHGEDMWKSMLNQEYGKEIAKSGRLGIGDQLLQGMIKMQEARDNEKAALASAAAPAAPENTETAAHDAAVALVAGSRLPAKR